ncbi:MAG TPA: hypothetical protein VNO55_29705, partial [Polyangia bacterium]|nr:hypothetical protein [Polyangia bacterium]
MGLALLATVLAGAAAHGETVDATSTTLLVGRQDPRDGVIHTAVPAYELVSVRATDLRLRGVEDLNVVMSGWGAVVLGDTL